MLGSHRHVAAGARHVGGQAVPAFAHKVQKADEDCLFVILLGFIGGALAANLQHFMNYISWWWAWCSCTT